MAYVNLLRLRALPPFYHSLTSVPIGRFVQFSFLEDVVEAEIGPVIGFRCSMATAGSGMAQCVLLLGGAKAGSLIGTRELGNVPAFDVSEMVDICVKRSAPAIAQAGKQTLGRIYRYKSGSLFIWAALKVGFDMWVCVHSEDPKQLGAVVGTLDFSDLFDIGDMDIVTVEDRPYWTTPDRAIAQK
jgi:hypothetical protein